MLNAVSAASCDADVEAVLPEADLSSESPKSRECRESVLLKVESMVDLLADRCRRLSGKPMMG